MHGVEHVSADIDEPLLLAADALEHPQVEQQAHDLNEIAALLLALQLEDEPRLRQRRIAAAGAAAISP